MSVRTSVCPSVCPQIFCTSVYNGNRAREIFNPNEHRFTKLKPNEIFNDSSISRDPTDRIGSDFFILNVHTLNWNGPDRTKTTEVRTE